ncbi:hypothetical protein P9209_18805 [Prescottella defluvii]|nr:hypothetical protein P9209_18805 [Prescottella defluvii]
MSLTCRFVVVRRLDLEPAGQHYMQVYLNDDMSYDVEYREGGPDRHFQALVPTNTRSSRWNSCRRCFRPGPLSGPVGARLSPGPVVAVEVLRPPANAIHAGPRGIPCLMPTTLRRALRYAALALVAVLAGVILYTVFVYHSLNIFTPPERLESLGRTYQLGNHDGYTRDEIDQRHRTSATTLEEVSYRWPRHPVYQFQNDTIRGQPPPAPTSNGAIAISPTASPAAPEPLGLTPSAQLSS